MKIVYWARLPAAREEIIAHVGAVQGIEFVVAHTLDELLGVLPGTHGLILYTAPLEQARRVVDVVRASCPQMGWMHFLSAGRDGFVAAGMPPGVSVTGAIGASAPVVAEHAMALLLALGRCMPQAMALAASGQWDQRVGRYCTSLEGAIVAVLGFGPVGQAIARRLRAFDARVIALTRRGAAHALAHEARALSRLHETLAQADATLLALPLTPDTRHLIDGAALRMIKPGARLVNVSRGALIDSTALLDALRNGPLGAAGLDVTEPEPLPPGHPLWRCPNLIVTPHVAADGSPATARRQVDGALANLRRFISGEPLLDVLTA